MAVMYQPMLYPSLKRGIVTFAIARIDEIQFFNILVHRGESTRVEQGLKRFELLARNDLRSDQIARRRRL